MVVRQAGAQIVALVLQGRNSLLNLRLLLPRRCDLLLGARQLTLNLGQIGADPRVFLFGPLQAVAHLAQRASA